MSASDNSVSPKRASASASPLSPAASPSWLSTYPKFRFPYSVLSDVLRNRALLHALLCIVAASLMFDERWARVLVACLLADSLAALLAGPRASLTGAVGEWPAFMKAPADVDFVPAVNAQPVLMVETLFLGISTLVLFLGEEEDANQAVAAVLVLLVALLGLAHVALGRPVPGSLPGLAADSLSMQVCRLGVKAERKKLGVERSNKNLAMPPLTVKHDEPHEVPLRYKSKTGPFRMQDFSLVRHCRVSYFAAPMSLAALALVFKTARTSSELRFPRGLWVGTAVFAAVVSLAMLLLFLIKLVSFPRRVVKEFVDPIKGCFFSAMSITALIFVGLVSDELERFAEGLFWVAAPLQLLFAIVSMSWYVRTPISEDNVTPAIIVPVVGTLVAAVVAPGVDSSYVEAANLWFSFGYILWLVLLPVTLGRFFRDLWVHPKARSMLFFYIAPPAIALVAHQALNNAGLDFFSRVHYHAALGMFLMLLALAGPPYYYFSRTEFDMDAWAYSFPLSTLALASLIYNNVVDSTASLFLAKASIALATGVTLVLLANTFMLLVKRRVIFCPEEKWGPISFMKLVHFSLRVALMKMEGALKQAQGGDIAALKRFSKLFHKFEMVYLNHGMHEEEYVFKKLIDMFPHQGDTALHEHERDHLTLEAVRKLVNLACPETKSQPPARLLHGASDENGGDLGPDASSVALSKLPDMLKKLKKDVMTHLAGEEGHVMPAMRKYATLGLMKRMQDRVWNMMPADERSAFISFAVAHQGLYKRQLRFVRTWLWGSPEKAQELGKILYEGVERPLYERLARDAPAIIPRGLPGWHKYH